jgi:hypothetical protein
MPACTKTMVRYRVKPGEADRNAALVRDVYDALAETQPAGFRYATYRLEDGRTFVHFAWSEGDDGARPLTQLPAFKAFQGALRERCDEPRSCPSSPESGRTGGRRLPAATRPDALTGERSGRRGTPRTAPHDGALTGRKPIVMSGEA